MNAYPANRTEMKAYDTTVITSAYLKEAGREGQFLLKDYAGIAAEVDADTQQGIFVRSTFDATKVWVREGSWAMTGKDIRWYGAIAGAGHGAANHTAIQAAIDTRGRIVIPDDSNGDFEVNDTLLVRSNTTVAWVGNSFIKLTQTSSIGAVIVAYSEGPLGTIPPVPSENVLFDNPLVDGGNLGYAANRPEGENGVGGAFVRNLRIRGGIVKNCRHGNSAPIGTGGKGIQIEADVQNCTAEGTLIVDCTIGVETGGDHDGGISTGIHYKNLTMVRCDRMISLMQTYTPASLLVSDNSAVVEGVTGYDCGRESHGADEAAKQAFGAIFIDRYANAVIRDVTLWNDTDYGQLGALVRHYIGYNNKVAIEFNGNARVLVDNRTPAPGAGTNGNRTLNQYKVHHRGGAADYAVRNDIVAAVANEYDIRTSSVDVALYDSESAQANNHGRFHNLLNDLIIEGRMDRLAAVLGTGAYGTSARTDVGERRINNVWIPYGGPSPMILPLNTYADNAGAVAGGLTSGMLYKMPVAAGYQVMVVT